MMPMQISLLRGLALALQPMPEARGSKNAVWLPLVFFGGGECNFYNPDREERVSFQIAIFFICLKAHNIFIKK